MDQCQGPKYTLDHNKRLQDGNGYRVSQNVRMRGKDAGVVVGVRLLVYNASEKYAELVARKPEFAVQARPTCRAARRSWWWRRVLRWRSTD